MNVTIDRLLELAWTQCWQVAALAAVVLAITAIFCRRRPHLAYLLWMLVIVKALVPPVWSSPSGAFSWLLSESIVSRRVAVARELPVHEPVALTVNDTPLPAQEPVAAAEVAPPWNLAWALLGIWIVGAAALTLATAWRWIRLKRLLASTAEAAPSELADLFAQLARQIAPRRRPRLLVTSAPVGPAALGWWQGTVVIPAELVRTHSATELSPILAHELIHLRRYDTLAGGLQLVAQCLWWFHPAVWWASHRARFERERSCDEAVVAELACRPADYAQLLVRILEWRQQLALPLPWPSMRAGDVTAARLEHVLKRAQSFRRRTPAWTWLLAIVIAGAAIPGAGLQWIVAAPPEEPQTVDLDFAGNGPTGTFSAAGESTQIPGELQTLTDDLKQRGLELHARVVKEKLSFTGVFTKDFAAQAEPFPLEKIPNLVMITLQTYNDQTADALAAKLKAVRQLGAETTLHFDSKPAFGAAFNELGRIPRLRKLMIGQSLPPLGAPGGRTLRLDDLANLETLVLSDTDDAALAEVRGLKGLKKFTAYGNITEAALGNLSQLTELTYLLLAHANPAAREATIPLNLAWIENLTNLTQLQIAQAFLVTDEGTARVARLSNLERLSLDEALSDAGLANLARMTNLRSLMIQVRAESKLTPQGFAVLGKLVNLRQFELFGTLRTGGPLINDDVLNAWRGMRELRVLVAVNCGLSDHCVPALRSWPKLRVLELAGNVHLTDQGLAGWGGELRRLSMPIPNVSNQGIAALGRLTELRKLDLWQAGRITDAGLEGLKPLAQATNLTLSGATLQGPGVAALAHWPQLRVLSLANTRLADTALRDLGKIAQLTNLDLANTDLTNERMKFLLGLARVQTLNLTSNSQLGDDGLAELAPLKNLREVRVHGTQVTAAGRKRLADAIPNLHVGDGNVWLSLIDTEDYEFTDE